MNLRDSNPRSDTAGSFFQIKEGGEAVKPSRVLFLTPIEGDVWKHIIGLAKRVDGELRFPITADDECLHAFWKVGDQWSATEYADVFSKFVEKGLISKVGRVASQALDVYRLNVDLRHIRVTEIDERRSAIVDSSWYSIIQDLENRKFIPRQDGMAAFRRWLEQNYPDVKPKTAITKLVYFNPKYPYLCMGVIVKDGESGSWLVVWRGFEAYDFRVADVVPEAVIDQSETRRNHRLQFKVETLEWALLASRDALRRERKGREADRRRLERALMLLKRKWFKRT